MVSILVLVDFSMFLQLLDVFLPNVAFEKCPKALWTPWTIRSLDHVWVDWRASWSHVIDIQTCLLGLQQFWLKFWLHAWLNSWLHGWMHGWLHSWMHAWMYSWVHSWLHSWVHSWVHSWLRSWLHSWVHSWMHSWLQIWLLVMLVLFLVQLLLMMIDLRLWLRKGCYDLLNVVIVMKCRIHDWSY